jgi:hypothetical protein
MNISTIIDGLGLLIYVGWVVMLPFDKRRVRAGWAKIALFVAGGLGISMCVINLMQDLHWIDESYIQTYRVAFRVILFLLFVLLLLLLLSGQHKGAKQDEKPVA